MGWFKKKQKPDSQSDKSDKDKKKEEEYEKIVGTKTEYEKYRLKDDEYWAIVKEQSGGTTSIRRFVRCKRFQYEDGVVTLKPVNKKENFEEIFPQLEDDFVKIAPKDLQSKIDTARDTLKKIYNGDIKNQNIWNVRYDIHRLEAMRRKAKFGSCSFQTLNEYREPCFTFLRKGSHLHPMAEDIDTSTIYVPSDYKKKKSSMSVRNKENKYAKYASSLISAGAAILLIAGVVIMIVNSLWSYKLYTYSDSKSQIALIEERFDQSVAICLERVAVESKAIADTAINVKAISNEVKDHLKPTTVIEGQQPIDFE